jgi:hypothetical protein
MLNERRRQRLRLDVCLVSRSADSMSNVDRTRFRTIFWPNTRRCGAKQDDDELSPTSSSISSAGGVRIHF